MTESLNNLTEDKIMTIGLVLTANKDSVDLMVSRGIDPFDVLKVCELARRYVELREACK